MSAIIKACAAFAVVIFAAHGHAREALPYCGEAKWLDTYLRKHGFVPFHDYAFKSGAAIRSYRFMGDTLVMALTPEGQGCLLPMGMLQQPFRR